MHMTLEAKRHPQNTSNSRAKRTINVETLPSTVLTAVLLFLLLTSACSKNSPEQVVEDYLAAATNAFEKRKISDVRALISSQYHDEEQRSYQDVVGTAAAYILGHSSIHTLTRIHSITLQSDGKLAATVLAAMAAKPVTDISTLTTLNADLYWFTILLVEEEGHWLLAKASWRQAMLDDFL